MSRLLVIGLDGATFDLIQRMGKDRPTVFDEVKERGCHGTLETIFPPLTGPAWISFQVGKNPGRHGVYDFFKYEGLKEGDIKVVSTDDIDGTTFYETLVEGGAKCTILHMPISYPPRIDATMVTGFFSGQDGCFFPKSLEKDLDLSDFNVFLLEKIREGDLKGAAYWKQFEHLRSVVRGRYNVGKQLLQRDWDFFFYMFAVTDHISHLIYEKVVADVDDKDTRAARALLDDIEGYIREMLDIAGRDTDVLFMSDHGFRSYHDRFLVNTWLYKEGYLKAGTGEGKDVLRSAVREEDKTTLRTLPLMISKVPGLRRVASFMFRALEDFLPFKVDARLNIDFEDSLAFCPGFNIRGLFINDDRFYGKVAADDVKTLRDEMIGKLKALDVFDKVAAKEEVYHGDRLRYAPDILLYEKDAWVGADFIDFDPVGPMPKNNHSMDGIFMAVGPNIRKGVRLERSSIMDLAPTILHMFGHPVDEDVDGRVLTDIFEPGSDCAKREVRRERTGKGPRERKGFERTKEEEDMIKERLRSLGYLG